MQTGAGQTRETDPCLPGAEPGDLMFETHVTVHSFVSKRRSRSRQEFFFEMALTPAFKMRIDETIHGFCASGSRLPDHAKITANRSRRQVFAAEAG
jgi:hypothetical protein